VIKDTLRKEKENGKDKAISGEPSIGVRDILMFSMLNLLLSLLPSPTGGFMEVK
jgi:hypothetical protein